MSKPTVGSLFSGIGGFDLGLELAGWGVEWQVEWHEERADRRFRRDVLRRHWPERELRGDVRTDTDGLWPVDAKGLRPSTLPVHRRAWVASPMAGIWEGGFQTRPYRWSEGCYDRLGDGGARVRYNVGEALRA